MRATYIIVSLIIAAAFSFLLVRDVAADGYYPPPSSYNPYGANMYPVTYPSYPTYSAATSTTSSYKYSSANDIWCRMGLQAYCRFTGQSTAPSYQAQTAAPQYYNTSAMNPSPYNNSYYGSSYYPQNYPVQQQYYSYPTNYGASYGQSSYPFYGSVSGSTAVSYDYNSSFQNSYNFPLYQYSSYGYPYVQQYNYGGYYQMVGYPYR